jgi:hypothetical protein
MQRDASSPEAYVKLLEGPQRELLETLRGLIAEAAPDVVETVGSGMLDYPGLANLGAQKRYVSLYVAPKVLAEHRAAFDGIECGKSCIRYKRLDQVEPKAVRALLRDVLKYRRAKAD